jgi:hypothetical protein
MIRRILRQEQLAIVLGAGNRGTPARFFWPLRQVASSRSSPPASRAPVLRNTLSGSTLMPAGSKDFQLLTSIREGTHA